MGVEFMIDGDSAVVSLSHSDFKKFNPAFEHLKAKTGIMVDEYRDGRISPEHAGLMLEFILENVSLEKTTNGPCFTRLLKFSLNQKQYLRYEGD